jgi:hypothetical protein
VSNPHDADYFGQLAQYAHDLREMQAVEHL